MSLGRAASTEFIAGLPKCELHVHLEGTLEVAMRRALVQRHRPPADDPTTADTVLPPPGDFPGLAAFLADYYDALTALRDEQDFYDLAAAYLAEARDNGVRYAEMFFDPQAHTARGVPFDYVVNGIHRAQVDARTGRGPDSQLIMCFLRDATAESAMATLAESLPYQEWIVGVGLDSDERGNPPVKFAEVFRRARTEGYRLTMHCDPDQDDSLRHLWECLDLIGVERIDHGVNCLQDERLCQEIRQRRIGLTVCPLSNLRLYGDLKAQAVRSMLERDLLVTVNSDDPAYFGGYLNDNLSALAEAATLTEEELARLARNSFEVAWMPPDRRQAYLSELDAYVRSAR